LQKPVLLVDRRVPFDLRRRVLLYDYSARGCKRLEKALRTTYTQSCQISTEKRPNQTLLVIGQLVVGLYYCAVWLSQKGLIPGVTEPCGGLLRLGGVTFVKARANSLFLRVFFAYSLTADVLPEGLRQ
jgi:hypothetical protein